MILEKCWRVAIKSGKNYISYLKSEKNMKEKRDKMRRTGVKPLEEGTREYEYKGVRVNKRGQVQRRDRVQGNMQERKRDANIYVFWNKRSIRVPIVANHTLPRHSPLSAVGRGFSSGFLRELTTTLCLEFIQYQNLE